MPINMQLQEIKHLIDYLRGTNSYRTGRWQGYREDLQATIDLGKTQTVNTLSLGCLQDVKSWIFTLQL